MARRALRSAMSLTCVHSASPWVPCAVQQQPSCRTGGRSPTPRFDKLDGTPARYRARVCCKRNSGTSKEASAACRALRKAALGDLEQLVELEALTNSSWTPQQIEVHHSERLGHPGLRTHSLQEALPTGRPAETACACLLRCGCRQSCTGRAPPCLWWTRGLALWPGWWGGQCRRSCT